ncbi:MAG: hypothetical protein ABIA74_00615 [bacterium]
MKKFSIILLSSILILISFFQIIFAVQKGSDTVISIQPEAIFPAADSDNAMLAFGWFKQGFVLENNSTTCTFESVFPVSSNINMNGGTLYLNADLNFNNFANIIGGGIFWGQDHLIELSETTTNLSDGIIFNNTKIFFYANLSISGDVTFEGDCTLNGHGCSINLDTNGKIIIAPNSTLLVQQSELYNVGAGKIICLADSSRLLLDEVKWYQESDYTFTQGSIGIYNNVIFGGDHTFDYDSAQTSSIFSDSCWHFLDNIVFSIGRKESINDLEPLWMEDHSSGLHLDNCNFDVKSNGICILNGSLFIDREVFIHTNSTYSCNGLILGNGIPDNDPQLRFYPGANLYLYPGHLTYDIIDNDQLAFQNTYAQFTRKNYHVLNVLQDLNLTNVIVSNEFQTSMPIADGKKVTYNNCHLKYPSLEFDLTGTTQGNIFLQNLEGNGLLNLTKGTFPAWIIVKNKNNYVTGEGRISGPIILQDENAEVRLLFDGLMDNGIMLNGGTLILEHDLVLSQNGGIGGTGYANLSSYNLILGNRDVSWTSSIYMDGDHSVIKLNANVIFSSDVTFSGIFEVEGNGERVEFVDGCNLKIEKGSTIIFRNISLNNLGGDKLICLDDNSKIILDNVAVNLNGNYTFSIGSLEILNNVDLKGSYTFEYNSNIPIKINTYSELLFDDEITIKLGDNIKTPFLLTDKTSILKTKNANFKIGPLGLQVTKGTFFFGGTSIWESDSTSSYDSLIFGDGNSENDALLKIGEAATVLIKKGAVVYNNTDPEGFKSTSQSNRFVRNANTYYYATQDQTLKDTYLDLDPTAPLIVSENKTFAYDNCTVAITGVVFQMTAQRYNEYTILMRGNDSIFVKEGILPLYLLVQDSNNKLYGTGSISGSIILSNSDSQLELGLFGEILNNIQLNYGTLLLATDTEIAKDNIISGPGTVNMATKNLYLGSRNTSWETPILWQGNDALLSINSKIDLKDTWTFEGICAINGNLNLIELSQSGSIYVKDNTTLTLRNLTIKGADSDRIICAGNNSKIIFDNTTLMLTDGDYNFDTGSFEILNKVEIRGNQTFSYKTTETSIIHTNAEFYLKNGATFSYAPTTTNDDLIIFEDPSSMISFHETSLHSTTTGMKLTKGTMKIKGLCYFNSDATNEAEGIKLGDGVNEESDFTVNIEPESSLNLVSGHLVIQNVN